MYTKKSFYTKHEYYMVNNNGLQWEHLFEKNEQGQIPKSLKIWNYEVEVPVLQGGMGIGISNAELAGNVALNGWIWTLSATAIHKTPAYREMFLQKGKEVGQSINGKIFTQEDFDKRFLAAKIEGIKQEVKKAKEIAQGNGAIFINIMVATTDYKEQVLAACEAGVDGIVSGAGLPSDLPVLTKDHPNVALVPILSNKRGVDIILNKREKNCKDSRIAIRLPDAIILEDPNTAWWHLWATGKSVEIVENSELGIPVVKIDDPEGKLETSIPEVLALLKERNLSIPIIWAGWIADREDAEKIFALKASGVQLWTRFLASKESGASDAFKNDIVEAQANDIITYQSSAKLAARALKKSPTFVKIAWVEAKTRKCIENCLNRCAYRDWSSGFAQMCINNELVQSLPGGKEKEEGLLFTGTSAIKINSVLTVKEIMELFT